MNQSTAKQNFLCAQWRLRSAWASAQSLLCIQWVAKDPRFFHVQSEDWSDWANAQADLSLHWAHRSSCWFCCVVAYYVWFSSVTCQQSRYVGFLYYLSVRLIVDIIKKGESIGGEWVGGKEYLSILNNFMADTLRLGLTVISEIFSSDHSGK